MRFSLFSVLDHYAEESPTLPTLYTQLLEQIVEAERLGFDACWIGEHHGYLAPHAALVCPHPAVVLAAAAQCTRRIGLNTAVANLSLRHPLVLAEDYALVDLLSQGRLGFGIGRGSYAHEYAPFGQKREESQERFVESWEIIQQAWRGETVTFHGRYYQIDDFKLNVLPVQKPLPRYWFSVMKKESFTALGRAAQPVITMPHLSADNLETLAQMTRSYQQHYLEAGGDPICYELPLFLYTCVASTRAEAQQEGREALFRYLSHQHQNIASSHIHHKIRQLMENKQVWFGTPDDLIQWIEQYQASIDSRHFVFWLNFGGLQSSSIQRSMHLLAREVMPYFHAPVH